MEGLASRRWRISNGGSRGSEKRGKRRDGGVIRLYVMCPYVFSIQQLYI